MEIKNIDKIPYAEFNLLVSPWVGLESVQFLEQKFGTPYLHYPVLPIGAFESSKFLRAVSEFTGIDSDFTEELILILKAMVKNLLSIISILLLC